MTKEMRSLVTGLIAGLFGHGIYEAENDTNYAFNSDEGLLIINRDDGSLDYSFSETDFSLTVTEV